MSDEVAAGPDDSAKSDDGANSDDSAKLDDSGVAIARRFLRRRLIRDVSLVVVGVLLLAAGVVGFVQGASASGDLTDSGVRATATAVAVHPGGAPFGLDDQIDVTFRAKGNKVIVARCYTSSADQFAAGQPVVIFYDPHNPARAQLADDPDLGPTAAPLTAALLLGLLLAVPAALATYRRRGATAALQAEARQMTEAKFSRHRMVLRSPDSGFDSMELRVTGQLRRFPRETTPVQILTRTPNTPTLIIHKPNKAVAIGRP
jgi:hypothetical protein